MTLPPMGNGVNTRRTPRALFDALHAEFRFTVDAASTHENALLPRHWTEREDGLVQPWAGERIWCNPPYGRDLLAPWVEKAARLEAEVSVLLVPVRTEQPWFHDYVLGGGAEVRFLRGRVKFDGLRAAPFPSMLVVFRGAPS